MIPAKGFWNDSGCYLMVIAGVKNTSCHSSRSFFGEYSAMVAAGALELQTMLTLAK